MPTSPIAPPVRADGIEGLAAPALAWFADLDVEVAVPIEVGRMAHGLRRVVPITGGTCVGRGFAGTVLPGGADFQLVASPTMARLEARYVVETEAGDRIYVHNDALRVAAPEAMARLVRGEPVDPEEVYFRCLPRFECAAPSLAWIGERVFVGVGVRRRDTVHLRFFEVA
jgi:hypothetical protein